MEPAAVLPRLRRAVLVALGGGVLLAAAPGFNPAPDFSLSKAAANPGIAGAISDVALRPLASGLGSVTSIANAGDARLFLTLRRGRIVVWDGTRVRHRAFLDISRIVSCCGARGLLSVAFHPRYSLNGFFFVAYTDKAGNLLIARYKRSAARSDRADPASGVVLLTIAHPPAADHHGGALQFGPDGYLYVGVGDGGSGKETAGNGQRDDVLLGKILRLDVDANAARPPFYGIPPSNPFVSAGPPLDEIWAKGLRDPWRFSFDRETGDLYIGDVGQNGRQEVDFQPRSSRGGENYGWEVMEGSVRIAFGGSGSAAGPAPDPYTSLRPPMLEYGRWFGDCAVVGGYVYRGSRDPRLSGVYFYGDYCTGRIWAGGQLTNALAPSLATFGEDFAGEMYVGTETGVLYRIVSPPPVLSEPPSQAVTMTPPESVPETAPLFESVGFPELETPALTASSSLTDALPAPTEFAPPPETVELFPDADEPPPAFLEPPPEMPTPPPPAAPDRQNPTVPREPPPARTVKPHE